MQFEENAQWEIDNVVVRVFATAEDRLLQLRQTDYGEELAFNFNLLAESVPIWKQCVCRFRAKDDVRRVVLIVNLVEPASREELHVENVFDAGSVTFENYIFRFATLVADRVCAHPKLWALVTQ